MSNWKLDDGREIHLITSKEFEVLPDDVELLCIDGKTYVKGKDEIDQDTRGGHLAFGFEIRSSKPKRPVSLEEIVMTVWDRHEGCSFG